MSNLSVSDKECGCFFCEMPAQRIVMENAFAFVVRDGFPVTAGHSLVIPRRHTLDYFGLTQDELIACHELIHSTRQVIINEDPTVTGFNLGTNAGIAAGQTVFHCHLHLIPRREGDVQNPRGGVRHIIPGKGHY